jgi:hypothetical protein
MFFELAGPYVGQTHGAAFPVFAAQVEALVQQDVTAWTAQAAAAAQAVQQANAASS